MHVLIVGGGGREHAFAWKVAQSDRVGRVSVAPGNAGSAAEPKVQNVAIGAEDIPGLLDFAQNNGVDLTIVGPEAPLVAGIVDQFTQAGLRCFGPSAAAAQLEGSKAFTKDFLQRHNIPTAAYATFEDADAAREYVRKQTGPLVVKADGLAAGKGVVIAPDQQAALDAVEQMLEGGAFGAAGSRIVVEEFLLGEEASFIVIVGDGQILPLASSQDHKARDAGDKGPNTGGMGAYSPAPVVTAEMHDRIMTEVIQPTVEGMAAEGIAYGGFLYAGVMIDPQGVPKVLEFNCRFGDPETQPILMRLESDLASLCEAAIDGQLAQQDLQWSPQAAVGVVLAAGGYPGSYAKGDPITGLAQAAALPSVKVFHAGTALRAGEVVTNGGRVLCVTALGGSVGDAQRQAYVAAELIDWPGRFFREDIGYRAVAREQEA
ncbi:MAG: phosphoribosylamine--glycine ligase [Gammaproteobacteria bacterium]|nr:MAG: phosphoribosylamine--glycine ligase [Gammaproteobacteria bacterium]